MPSTWHGSWQSVRNQVSFQKVASLGNEGAQLIEWQHSQAELHCAGLIHGKVTASSVFVNYNNDSKQYDAYLGEFGWANLLASRQLAWHTTDHREVMAPEHSQGQPTSCATDIWCLCILVVELLTGIAPVHRVNGTPCGLLHVLMCSGSQCKGSSFRWLLSQVCADTCCQRLSAWGRCKVMLSVSLA